MKGGVSDSRIGVLLHVVVCCCIFLLYILVVYSCCVFLLSVLVACSCCIFLLTFDEQNSPFLPNAFPVPQHMVQPARFALFHAGTNAF